MAVTAVPGTYADTPAGDSVNLDFRSSTGTGSLTYSASVSGPGNATLSGPASHPQLSLPTGIGGYYTLSLTVTDSTNATNTATTTIGAQVQCVKQLINGVLVNKPVIIH